MGRGCYVFNRRSDHLRCAVLSMVERCLNPSLPRYCMNNKMPAILALRVMLWLIHLFQVYASQIYKTILPNEIV